MNRTIYTLCFSLLTYCFYAQSPNIEWDNTIGGNSDDGGTSIRQTSDNGYILAGYSASTISGDKTGFDGGYDI